MSRKKRSSSTGDGAAVCPSCGEGRPAAERFCPACRMPLVPAGGGEEPPSEAREWARKIDPRYAGGPLVRAASTGNQAEAELVQNLLIEEGIPSMVRRSGGFDVPDFLAAGPRDVLVPSDGVEAARQLLHAADLAPLAVGGTAEPESALVLRPLGIAAAVTAGAALTALVAWLLSGG